MTPTLKIAGSALLCSAVAFWLSGRPSDARDADLRELDQERGAQALQVAQVVSQPPTLDGAPRGDDAGDEEQTPAEARLPPLSPDVVDVYFDGRRYWYDNGLWYLQSRFGWDPVQPPVGARVDKLPPSYTTRWVDGVPYYYATGVWYMPASGAYQVTQLPQSAISTLP
jgi:hypothetical protein